MERPEKEKIPLTEEEKKYVKKEFDEADNRLDKVLETSRSNVTIKKKAFMTISDVDREDAAWFKKFSDEHTSGKQFLGIKVIR